MGKKGVIVIFVLFIMVLLSFGYVTSIFVRSTARSRAAQYHANSVKAFWLAEAGVARVLGTAGLSSQSGSIGSPAGTYTATVTSLGGNYYQITSVGTMPGPGGSTVSRTVYVTVRTGNVDPLKFKYGIESTTDIVIKGSVGIYPSSSFKEYSTLDFADLFTVTKATMQANATHLYTAATFAAPVDAITWVNVPGGSTLNISGNLVGSGILVINGDCHISGTVQFDGIIYVIGQLTMTGTVETTGAVLAESSTTVDTELKGTVDIYYDQAAIAAALAHVAFLTKQNVAWKEKL